MDAINEERLIELMEKYPNFRELIELLLLKMDSET